MEYLIKKPKILVVDDSPENIRILIETLKEDYSVIPAKDGNTALIKAKAEPYPDLILLDIIMPELNGYEVCKQLKEIEELKDIPVVFLTSKNEIVDESKAFSLGAVDYITKPFQPVLVKARVKNHIEIKIKNQLLEQKSKELKEVNEALKSMTEMIVHDLKNPLSNIIMFSKHLESKLLSEERIKKTAALINNSSNHMAKMVENLLEITKIEAGKMVTEIEDFDLLPVVRDTLSDFSENAAKKSISINFNENGTSYFIQADKTKTREVLENLISNALKFSPAEKSVFIDLKFSGKNIILSVRDEGPGLTDDDKKQLFRKFSRLSAHPTGGEHTTGLGLSIVKKLMEAMNGDISCESEYGKGACFSASFIGC
jgi:two-component system sensor histidine kinase/response regulator